MSCRGMPVHAQTVSASVIFFVTSASPSAKLGKSSVIGVVQATFFSSTSFAIISVVSDFVVDPMRKRVFGVMACFFPASRTPNPFAMTTLSP